MTARVYLVAAAVFSLVACSEPSQQLHTGTIGKPAYDGTGSHFVASGWTPGNKNSWQQALQVRLQRGQNEYNKVN